MKSLHTIAVGYDGSTDAEIAVRWALHLAEQIGADVVAVHAGGYSPTRWVRVRRYSSKQRCEGLAMTANSTALACAGIWPMVTRAQFFNAPIMPLSLRTCWWSALGVAASTPDSCSEAPASNSPSTPPFHW